MLFRSPYAFEFPTGSKFMMSELLQMAAPAAAATSISRARTSGSAPQTEVRRLANSGDMEVLNGDQITLNSDQFPANIVVHVGGAELGDQYIALPIGATYGDLLQRLTPAPNANMAGVQLFRPSVAARQKATIEISLRRLESMALTGRSKVLEESQLRTLESQMLLNFIDRARTVVPLGQIVLGDAEKRNSTAVSTTIATSTTVSTRKKGTGCWVASHSMAGTAASPSNDSTMFENGSGEVLTAARVVAFATCAVAARVPPISAAKIGRAHV